MFVIYASASLKATQFEELAGIHYNSVRNGELTAIHHIISQTTIKSEISPENNGCGIRVLSVKGITADELKSLCFSATLVDNTFQFLGTISTKHVFDICNISKEIHLELISDIFETLKLEAINDVKETGVYDRVNCNKNIVSIRVSSKTEANLYTKKLKDLNSDIREKLVQQLPLSEMLERII